MTQTLDEEEITGYYESEIEEEDHHLRTRPRRVKTDKRRRAQMSHYNSRRM